MRHQVFTAPATFDGSVTLQADRATWEAVRADLEARGRERGPREVRELAREAIRLIDAALPGEQPRAVRVVLPEDVARLVQQLAEVSG